MAPSQSIRRSALSTKSRGWVPSFGACLLAVLGGACASESPRDSVAQQTQALVQSLMLSEVKADPANANTDDQYIELSGTQTEGQNLLGYYVVVVDNRAATAGSVEWVLDLGTACTGGTACSLGTNGILMITTPNGPAAADGATRVTSATFELRGSGGSNTDDYSILLVYSPTTAITTSSNLNGAAGAGAGGAGSVALPSGATLVDAVGWTEQATAVIGGVTLPPTTTTDMPDAVTRIPGNTTPLSAGAWYYGELSGADSNTYTNNSGNVPTGLALTPGAPNVEPGGAGGAGGQGGQGTQGGIGGQAQPEGGTSTAGTAGTPPAQGGSDTAGTAGTPPAEGGSAGAPPAQGGSAGTPPAEGGSAGTPPAEGGSAGTAPVAGTAGATASGGTTTATGGTTTATGGTTTATGGTTTAAGGTTTATGGTKATGGATTATGGSTATSGGTSPAAGTSATAGGTASATGGAKTGGKAGSGTKTGGTGTASSSEDDGGCGCRTPSSGKTPWGGAMTLAALLGAVAIRRRRRS